MVVEDEVVTYICEFYSHLMTPFEQRVNREWFAQKKAEGGAPGVGDFIREKNGLLNDPQVEAALADGIVAFRQGVSQRLLKENPDAVFLNRCEKCSRIARTPKARQCFHCGHDWHDVAN